MKTKITTGLVKAMLIGLILTVSIGCGGSNAHPDAKAGYRHGYDAVMNDQGYQHMTKDQVLAEIGDLRRQHGAGFHGPVFKAGESAIFVEAAFRGMEDAARKR